MCILPIIDPLGSLLCISLYYPCLVQRTCWMKFGPSRTSAAKDRDISSGLSLTSQLPNQVQVGDESSGPPGCPAHLSSMVLEGSDLEWVVSSAWWTLCTAGVETVWLFQHDLKRNGGQYSCLWYARIRLGERVWIRASYMTTRKQCVGQNEWGASCNTTWLTQAMTPVKAKTIG